MTSLSPLCPAPSGEDDSLTVFPLSSAVAGHLQKSTAAIQPSSFLSDINECASSPCLNGGTCVDEVSQFSCVCGKGWSGPTCQTPLPTCKQQTHNQTCWLKAGVEGFHGPSAGGPFHFTTAVWRHVLYGNVPSPCTLFPSLHHHDKHVRGRCCVHAAGCNRRRPRPSVTLHHNSGDHPLHLRARIHHLWPGQQRLHRCVPNLLSFLLSWLALLTDCSSFQISMSASSSITARLGDCVYTPVWTPLAAIAAPVLRATIWAAMAVAVKVFTPPELNYIIMDALLLSCPRLQRLDRRTLCHPHVCSQISMNVQPDRTTAQRTKCVSTRTAVSTVSVWIAQKSLMPHMWRHRPCEPSFSFLTSHNFSCSLLTLLFVPPAAVNATLVQWTTGHVPRPLTPSPTITWPWCPTSRPPGSCSGCRRCVRSATRSVSPCSGESKRAATSQCSVRTVWRVSWCWSVLCRGPPRWRLRWRWPSWRGEPSWEDTSPK